MEKPEVGQQLFSLNVGNEARHKEQVLTPVTVMKVGRKYFYAAQDYWKDSEHMWTKYHIDTWRQSTDYFATSVLYRNKQDWEDKKEADMLHEKIFTRYGAPKLSLNALRKINEIIENDQ